MAKYLLTANYVGEGVKGLLTEGGSSRRDAVEKLASSLGGTVEQMYYAFGPTDVYAIVDFPDHVSAAAASLVTSASGLVHTSVTVLLSPEDVDEAARKSPVYRGPGA